MAAPSNYEKEFETLLGALRDRERAAAFKSTYEALVSQKTRDADYLRGGMKDMLKLMDEGREEAEKQIQEGGRTMVSAAKCLLMLHAHTAERQAKAKKIEHTLEKKISKFHTSFNKFAVANSTALTVAYDGIIKTHVLMLDEEIKRLLGLVAKYKIEEVRVGTRYSI